MTNRSLSKLATLICTICLGLCASTAYGQSHHDHLLDMGENTMSPADEADLDKEKRRGGHRSAPILEVSVSPTTIEPGESVTLKWDTRFAKKGVLFLPENQRYKKKGEIKLIPRKTTDYKLVASNKYGSTVEAFTIEVIVRQDDEAPTRPQINNIYALGRSIGIDWVASSDNNTPQKEIVYQVHFAEHADYSAAGDLHFAGEVVGQTDFTIDGLPPNTEIDVFVSALDPAGNSSPKSMPATVETGEKGVVLKDNLTIIQLSESGIPFERLGNDIIVFLSRKDTPTMEIGDILIYADEANSFTARVTEVYRNTGREVEVRIEEISPFELILEGDVNLKLNFYDDYPSDRSNFAPQSSIMIKDRSISSGPSKIYSFKYGTDIGPLNIQTLLNIAPEHDVALSFDRRGIKKATGTIRAPWSIDLLTTLAASGATEAEKEFGLDPYEFNKTIRLKVGRVPLPIKIKLKTEVKGYASISTDGKIEASADTVISGVIDETLTYDGDLKFVSRTDTPSYEVTPKLTVVGDVSASVAFAPSVTLTVNKIFEQMATGEQKIELDVGAELIPNLAAVQQVFPDVLLHPTIFDITLRDSCSREGEVLVPFVDDVTVYSEQGCGNEFQLFSLPKIDLNKTYLGHCSEFLIEADDTDGVNNQFDPSTAQWFADEEGSIHVGPSSQMHWEHAIGTEQAEVIFSGYGRLGEKSRRFESVSLDYLADLVYYIDYFADIGLYAEGETQEAVCHTFNALPGVNDDGDWHYMGLVGNQCYFAFGGVPTEDLDVYVPIHVKSTCS